MIVVLRACYKLFQLRFGQLLLSFFHLEKYAECLFSFTKVLSACHRFQLVFTEHVKNFYVCITTQQTYHSVDAMIEKTRGEYKLVKKG